MVFRAQQSGSNPLHYIPQSNCDRTNTAAARIEALSGEHRPGARNEPGRSRPLARPSCSSRIETSQESCCTPTPLMPSPKRLIILKASATMTLADGSVREPASLVPSEQRTVMSSDSQGFACPSCIGSARAATLLSQSCAQIDNESTRKMLTMEYESLSSQERH